MDKGKHLLKYPGKGFIVQYLAFMVTQSGLFQQLLLPHALHRGMFCAGDDFSQPENSICLEGTGGRT